MTQNGSSLAGKTGLITGGVHRIGAAIARQLHARGDGPDPALPQLQRRRRRTAGNVAGTTP